MSTLRRFLNMDEEDFVPCVAWLLTSLRGTVMVQVVSVAVARVTSAEVSRLLEASFHCTL